MTLVLHARFDEQAILDSIARHRATMLEGVPTMYLYLLNQAALKKKRWFRNAQRWRTGSEGRISLLKRRHGLNRCRYKGLPGIRRWVGLGVIADNLINIGHALTPSPGRAEYPLHTGAVARPRSLCHAHAPVPPPRPISQRHFCAGK